MARRVVLHAGLMKSGTSYLQDRLFLNRDQLVERGVLVPGRARGDQALSVQDLLGRHANLRSRGKWSELLGEMRRHDDAVVISMEFLGPLAPERIARVVDALDGPVEVVLTMRDLGRVVPAMWQERLKNGGTTGWREYVDGLAGEQQAARGFWWQQGAARIVRNWAEAVGPERVTVVTLPLPGADPGLLWGRFCEAVGIAGDGCSEVPPANASLDVESALVLLAMNQALAERGGIDSDFQLMLKFRLAKQVMASRTGGRPIGYEPSPWLQERAQSIVSKIHASGVRVVGDLAELTPRTVPGTDPEEVDAAATLGAAVDALVGITSDYFLRVSARGADDRP